MRKLLIAAIVLELLLISACGSVVEPQLSCTIETADNVIETESWTVIWCGPLR